MQQLQQINELNQALELNKLIKQLEKLQASSPEDILSAEFGEAVESFEKILPVIISTLESIKESATKQSPLNMAEIDDTLVILTEALTQVTQATKTEAAKQGIKDE